MAVTTNIPRESARLLHARREGATVRPIAAAAWIGWCAAVLLVLAGHGVVSAQSLRIADLRVDAQDQVSITVAGRAEAYYILQRGDEAPAIRNAVSIAPGAISVRLVDDLKRTGAKSAQFYRVQEVPVSSPLDSDGDGIDDWYELRFGSVLNPLDGRDAALDSDGDGKPNLAEYRAGTDPSRAEAQGPVTTFSSSPAPGESGVAVTRETVIRFNRPLGAGTVLNSEALFVEAAGRRGLSRVELSSDRLTATLFYLENLPANARIRVTLVGDSVTDSLGQPVDADGNGSAGGVGVVAFDTSSVAAIPGTAILGHVFASEPVGEVGGIGRNKPLRGVTITVDGAEEQLRAVTDAEGFFRLEPAPAGEFFVHIDGRTSPESQWPDGAYYPFVGKSWNAVAGRTNNLAGGLGQVFLPLVSVGTLQPVSATEATTVTFPPEVLKAHPELEGVSVTVPANALFAENGSRGGRVGIAPVPPDRLPGPLPDGLSFPLVITVQTDGPQNFDRPVPVRFPNLPDPTTGKPVPPGGKSALLSFNHDTGLWEVAGSMTASADGKFLETDPGVGIRQPGWHGTSSVTTPCLADGPCACAGGGGGGGGPGSGGLGAARDRVTFALINENERDQLDALFCSGDLSLQTLSGQGDSRGLAVHGAQGAAPGGCDGIQVGSLCLLPSPGIHHFAIYDPVSRQVISRGATAPRNQLMDLLLPADRKLVLYGLSDELRWVSEVPLRTGSPGQGTPFFHFPLLPETQPDADGDGLGPIGELVLGTDPTRSDTDGDGVPDGTELQLGSNPLDGIPTPVRIVAVNDTPGDAVDVVAFDELVIVADSLGGFSLFEARPGQNPILLRRVFTPSPVRTLGFSGQHLVVGQEAAGVLVYDLRDRNNPHRLYSRAFGSEVAAVTTAGTLGVVGLRSGEVVLLDLASGTILYRLSLSAPVGDLAVAGDHVFALTDSALHALALTAGELRPASSAPRSAGGFRQYAGFRYRLSMGEGVAYAAGYERFDIFDVRDPNALTRASVFEAQAGSPKQLVANGSGYGLAAVGERQFTGADDGRHDLHVYALADPKGPLASQIIPTPGVTHAVSIFNGRAFLADGDAGLTEVNYLADDTHGVKPSVILQANFQLEPASVEEGRLLRLTALVTDDVQVRNVEFYVDGVRVASDGSFPFEHRFFAPRREGGRTGFTIRARAFDTGGNVAETPTLTVALVDDATPPVVTRFAPAEGMPVAELPALAAWFSEPIQAPQPADFELRAAGQDNLLDTPDDQVIGGTSALREDGTSLFFSPSAGLTPGLFLWTLKPTLADRAGNRMSAAAGVRFWIVGGPDSDGDGLDDALERALGLDPAQTDSDGDAIPDAAEDLDGDGLATLWEIQWGYDPRRADTDGNGLSDGDEDLDFDGLSNRQEATANTNPRSGDTDRDGWSDDSEVVAGSNPADVRSQPSLFIVNQSPVSAQLAVPLSRSESQSSSFIMNQNPVSVQLAVPLTPSELRQGFFVAEPGVRIVPQNP